MKASLVCLLACAALVLALPDAPVTDHPGYKSTLFAHSFGGNGNDGGYAVGLAAHPDGSLYIGNYHTGTLSKWSVSQSGGTELDHKVGVLQDTVFPAGMKFSASGRLFVANQGNARVTEHTATGAFVDSCIRLTEFNQVTDLQIDPISQDIFVSTLGANKKVYRISNFATTIGTCVVTEYGNNAVMQSVDGMAFTADGTLYLAEFTNNRIFKLPPSNAGGATATPVLAVTGILNVDGLAISQDGRFLYGQTNDNRVRVFDFQANNWISGSTFGQPGQVSHTPTFNKGHRGDLATVGPDGCYYGGDFGQVIKITKADGTCDLFGQNVMCVSCNNKLRAKSCSMLPQNPHVQGC
eukprot:TRINITY_DN15278_c0_g1_i1.p1 TRINITY_DN15278_c0_g1~~TRINITY_DN15278_c0_g1_i1.p1  ORF type:complete len:352 (-),score=63.65 TRINITY_DN15278_c0_g1_i1:59-1114(-)